MLRALLFIFGILLCSCSSIKRGAFQSGVEGDSEDKIVYKIYYPKEYGKKDLKFPVVLFLHGAGERGDNNIDQLVHIVPKLVDSAFQAKHPCVVVVPQCPKSDYWAPVKRFEWVFDQSATGTKAMVHVITLMDKIRDSKLIDRDKIYVMGLSMGGFGTLDILSRKPEVFAAGVDICGGADLTKTNIYKDIPLWIFHGAVDPVVSVSLSRELVESLQSKGSSPIYTEYPTGGHDVWNTAAEDPNLWVWLFSQSKKN